MTPTMSGSYVIISSSNGSRRFEGTSFQIELSPTITMGNIEIPSTMGAYEYITASTIKGESVMLTMKPNGSGEAYTGGAYITSVQVGRDSIKLTFEIIGRLTCGAISVGGFQPELQMSVDRQWSASLVARWDWNTGSLVEKPKERYKGNAPEGED